MNDYKNDLNKRHHLYNEDVDTDDHDGDSTPIPPPKVNIIKEFINI